MTTETEAARAVKATLLAQVYEVAIKSPLERAAKLSKLKHTDVYLKREDLQPVHSFKLRGAYNKMSRLGAKERARGVIAASAGNHAQGVALAAKKLGVSALIVMPKTTPPIKVDAVRSYGAEVALAGDSYTDAYEYSLQLTKRTGRTFIHPFDDPEVISGQGTIGQELMEQLPTATHIFVPVGGGGLIAGVAQFVKAIRPSVKIIGVEPADSNAMQRSLKAGKPITMDHVGIFADGVAVKRVGDHAFALTKLFVDEIITVTTDQICAGIKAVFEDTRSIVEPAGALAAAGVMQYQLPPNAQAIAICSGANMTFERLQQVAERTLIGSGKEALFAITMPEQAGALRTFCEKVVKGHSITEFSYRLHERSQAYIFIGISITSEEDKQGFMQKMQKYGFTHTDLSDDDLAKEHVRHMIGGLAPAAVDEQLYSVIFPERPGALATFLAHVGDHYNISLFHYRTTASDSGNVLIGFEAKTCAKLEYLLDEAGYDYTPVQASPSARFLLYKPVP
jgi:threonine dehydratase